MDFSLLMGNYEDIVAEFKEEKIRQRYCNIVEKAHDFIIAYGFQDVAFVSDNHVMAAVTDYFTDILRLKKLHNIERVNKIKIVAYTAYWILRRKIIQISDIESPIGSTYINEKFVLSYLVDELTSGFEEDKIPDDGRFGEFINLLYYFLKYRSYDPQCIELMLMSYIAAFSIISNVSGVDISNYSIIINDKED